MDYKFENKTLLERFIEFFYSIKIINDCLNHINDGKEYHIIPIYGQLRALLAEKKTKNKPLLVDLAKELKYELKIFYSGYQIPKDDSLVLSLYFPKTKAIRTEKEDIETEIEKYLDLQVIKLGKYKFTIKDFIDLFANKLGGSHYDDKLREDFHLIKNINVLVKDEPLINHYAAQIANSIYDISVKFLTHFIDTSLYFTLFIPNQSINSKSWLFEISYPNSNLLLTGTLEENKKLKFRVNDLVNKVFEIEVTDDCIFEKLSTFTFNIFLTENLKTVMSIYIDKKCIIEKEFNNTILTVNDISNSSRVYNNSKDFSQKGVELGVFNFFVTNGFTKKLHNDNLKIIKRELKNNKLMWLKPNQYIGYIFGEKEAKINHDLKFIKTKKFNISN